MDRKAVLFLLFVLIIVNCDPQFNNKYQAYRVPDGRTVYVEPISFPPLSHYINEGIFAFPRQSPNTTKDQGTSVARPTNFQKPEYPEIGLVSAPNQNHFKTSDPKHLERPAFVPAIKIQRKELENQFKNFEAVASFSWELFKRINILQEPNSVICPLMLQLVLSHLAYVSKNKTKEEIVDSIKYNGPSQLNSLTKSMIDDKKFQLEAALFLSDAVSINPIFQQSLEKSLEIYATDFSNSESFSQSYYTWIAQKAKGNPSKARLKVHPSTKMILSSAAYFKGEWDFKFESNTVEDFYIDDITTEEVTMMKLKKELPYGQLDNGNLGEWISLPYKSNDSLIIILPSVAVTLDDMTQKIAINDVLNSMSIKHYVELTLPRFKIESKTSFVNPLKKLGINMLFGAKAEFKNLFGTDEPIFLSNLIQHAVLEVNEETSSSKPSTLSSGDNLQKLNAPKVEFKVDRPFVAMIVDHVHKFPYYIAKITNPSL